MARQKYRIGVLRGDYNWRRNITRHCHEGFDFVNAIDPFRILDSSLRRLGRRSEYVIHTHVPPTYPGVDLFHFWRMISSGSKPWIVSTSTGLPFGYPRQRMRRGMELLASDACKRIIATSMYAMEWQRRKANSFPDICQDIMEKVEIMHPPQDVVVESWEEKEALLGEEVSLAMVGKHFFRKGGLEILRVVDRLIKEGAAIKLHIASQLSPDKHSGSSHEDIARALEIINRHPQITLYEHLPNDEVLELFKRSHVGLLPSYVETYGYTVLEAQACACATITTNVFAFPEINSSDVGWVVDVMDGGYDYKSVEGRMSISESIERGLYNILSFAVENPKEIAQRGQAALDRIRDQHCPIRHAQRLYELYSEALSGR